MKRKLCIVLAVVLLLSACADRSGITYGKGSIEPPVSSSYTEEVEPSETFEPQDEEPASSSETSDDEKPSESSDVSVPAPPKQPASHSSEPTVSIPPAVSSEPPAPSSEPATVVPQSSVSIPPSSASEHPSDSEEELIILDWEEPEEDEEEEKEEHRAPDRNTYTPDEVKAIWISYLDFYSLAQNQNERTFTSNIKAAFEDIADYGLNTVFVQVRPFGDAMYESEIFPWSYVMTGTEGADPGYDPLAIMVETAQDCGLRIEAWINPYRVRATNSNRVLSGSNPAVRALERGDDMVLSYSGGLFYNPASQDARDLITEGVLEIVENYAVDGIHFDDYFYPTTDMSFDAASYRAYRNDGGTLTQADWRRQNVDLLVRQVYAAIKSTDPDVLFGISPQARMDNNYNAQFINVQKWLSNRGYIDYICPQIYFGFDNDTVPYASSLAEWESMAAGSGVDLYIGLAAYKCGVTDQWAGSGSNEWVRSTDLLMQMVDEARDASGYAGFVLYRYDSLFNPESSVRSHIREEMQNLGSIL